MFSFQRAETATALNYFALLTYAGRRLLDQTKWHFTIQQPNPGEDNNGEGWLLSSVLTEAFILCSCYVPGDVLTPLLFKST